jgi:hypothetical protein
MEVSLFVLAIVGILVFRLCNPDSADISLSFNLNTGLLTELGAAAKTAGAALTRESAHREAAAEGMCLNNSYEYARLFTIRAVLRVEVSLLSF